MDDMLLEEAVADEGGVHEPEQGQDEFEDDRRVQVIVDGIAMVREAVEAVGDDAVPGPDAQQQLQDYVPLLQLLALAIQVLFGNFMQIWSQIERPCIPDIRFDHGRVSRPNSQLYFRFY